MHGSIRRKQKSPKDVAPDVVLALGRGEGGDLEAWLGVKLMEFETFSFAALCREAARGGEAKKKRLAARVGKERGERGGERRGGEAKRGILRKSQKQPRRKVPNLGWAWQEANTLLRMSRGFIAMKRTPLYGVLFGLMEQRSSAKFGTPQHTPAHAGQEQKGLLFCSCFARNNPRLFLGVVVAAVVIVVVSSYYLYGAQERSK
ncbi:hypothetical protein V8C37DRAFT_394780 [Trichoderma ceciliae]